MKKFLCLFVAVLMAASVFSFSSSAAGYTDTEKGSWYYDAVEWCRTHSYMSGTSATTFSPSSTVTREMFLTVLVAYDGADVSQYTEDTPFADVAPDKWYSAAVRWAYANGLCAGMTETEFGVGIPVSRAQLATFFYTYSVFKGYDTSYRGSIEKFTDIPDGKWFTDTMAWAIGEYLIGGMSETTAAPTGNATRAQLAVILRAYDEYATYDVTIPEKNDPYADFVPVLRFAIGSDVHISESNTRPQEYLAKMFTSSYKYAEEHPTYNKVDAFILAGDIVNTMSEGECKIYNDTVAANLRSDSEFLSVLGNHEFQGELTDEAYIESLLGCESEIHKVIGGIHFIGISPIDGGNQPYYTKMDWLKEQLAIAYADTPDKPIIVFQHHPVNVGVDKLTAQFRNILAQYPNVIDFSGHSHTALGKGSVVQSEYTTVNMTTLGSYISGTDYDVSQNKHYEQSNAFMMVEIGADGDVLIRPYSMYGDRLWRTNSNLDNPEDTLAWYIERPWDRSTFEYTGNGGNPTAPIFARHAEIKPTKVTATAVTFTFPTALSHNGIDYYRIVITDTASGEVKADRSVFGFCYVEEPPASINKLISGLSSGRTYKMTITGYDAYSLQTAKPLSVTFTTIK